ncbi:hypothetical protein ACOSP7_029849 [Xanthoceras sorbifolium]
MQTMEKPTQKLVFIAFLMALAWGFAFSPIRARKLLMNFEMLPKGMPIPPSGPSRRNSTYPPPPGISSYSNSWNFEMLPKGVPIPPSGPSTRTSASPPLPKLNSYSNHWNFEMLPKGVPIPPSGPSRRC